MATIKTSKITAAIQHAIEAADDNPLKPRPTRSAFKLGVKQTYKSGVVWYEMDASKSDPLEIQAFIEEQSKMSGQIVVFGPTAGEVDERNIDFFVFPAQYKEWVEDGIDDGEYTEFAAAFKQLKAVLKRAASKK